MSQAADYAIDYDFAVREKNHVENDVAFQLQLTTLGRVFRFWFVQNRNRSVRGPCVDCFLLWRFHRHRLVAKTAGLNVAFLAALWRNSGIVSEADACDGPTNSLVAASTVSVTRSARQTGQTLPDDNVALLRVEFRRFHDGVGNRRNLNLHDFRRRRRRSDRNCDHRGGNFRDAEIQSRGHLLRIQERNHQKKNKGGNLDAGAQADTIPAALGFRERGETGADRLGANSLLPSLAVLRGSTVCVETDAKPRR